MTMEDRLDLTDFQHETNLMVEQEEREKVELAQFTLETQLLDKGVI